MSRTPNRCPKCDGSMEQGFILDASYTALMVSRWAPGPPQKKTLLGMDVGAKPPPSWIPVGTFRCGSCGYLEAYARDEFAPE